VGLNDEAQPSGAVETDKKKSRTKIEYLILGDKVGVALEGVKSAKDWCIFNRVDAAALVESEGELN